VTTRLDRGAVAMPRERPRFVVDFDAEVWQAKLAATRRDEVLVVIEAGGKCFPEEPAGFDRSLVRIYAGSEIYGHGSILASGSKACKRRVESVLSPRKT
jgi:hypothetical protein